MFCFVFLQKFVAEFVLIIIFLCVESKSKFFGGESRKKKITHAHTPSKKKLSAVLGCRFRCQCKSECNATLGSSRSVVCSGVLLRGAERRAMGRPGGRQPGEEQRRSRAERETNAGQGDAAQRRESHDSISC